MTSRLTWKERIKRARAKGKFSQSAKLASNRWPTCAVGERVPALADEDKYSEDVFNDLGDAGNELNSLGMDFYYAVQNDEVKDAARIYRDIRAVQLPTE